VQALRRNHGAVMNHIQGGLKIVNEFQSRVCDDQNQTLLSSKHMIRAFARLEQQLCGLQRDTSPKLILELMQRKNAVGYYEYSTPLPLPALHFSTVHDAWKALDQRWHAMQMWQMKLPSLKTGDPASLAILNQRESLTEDFSDWKNSFDALKKTKVHALTQREKRISALLYCHFIWAKQILEVAAETGEMLWDRYVNYFREVIDLCSAIVESEWRSSVLPLNAFSKNSSLRVHTDGNYSQTWSSTSASARSIDGELATPPTSFTLKYVNLISGEGTVPIAAGQR
jgi:hypothetical protein